MKVERFFTSNSGIKDKHVIGSALFSPCCPLHVSDCQVPNTATDCVLSEWLFEACRLFAACRVRFYVNYEGGSGRGLMRDAVLRTVHQNCDATEGSRCSAVNSALQIGRRGRCWLADCPVYNVTKNEPSQGQTNVIFTPQQQHGCDFNHKQSVNSTYRTATISSFCRVWRKLNERISVVSKKSRIVTSPRDWALLYR